MNICEDIHLHGPHTHGQENINPTYKNPCLVHPEMNINSSPWLKYFTVYRKIYLLPRKLPIVQKENTKVTTLNIACEHNLLEVTNIIDIHPHFSTRGLCFRLKNVQHQSEQSRCFNTLFLHIDGLSYLIGEIQRAVQARLTPQSQVNNWLGSLY